MTALSDLITTKAIPQPWTALVYGVEGIGKTQLATQAPKTVIQMTENGAGRFEGIAKLKPAKTYQEVLDNMKVLYTEDHDLKTYTVDTLDWLQPLIYAHVCQVHNKQSMEQFDYGAGNRYALEYWLAFLEKCEKLRHHRQMNILFLAHAKIKNTRKPGEESGYQTYSLALQDGENTSAARAVREWVDAVLFANYEEFIKQGKGGQAVIVNSQKPPRIIYTEKRPAFEAKSRIPMPPEIELGPVLYDYLNGTADTTQEQ
ncbi:MAG: ATP-binding protein [Pseudomonadota bacterium]